MAAVNPHVTPRVLCRHRRPKARHGDDVMHRQEGNDCTTASTTFKWKRFRRLEPCPCTTFSIGFGVTLAPRAFYPWLTEDRSAVSFRYGVSYPQGVPRTLS